eukprot:GHRR01006492.1.p3 GENE.GHRR01006492.1~~GHRR01006492.1.p3  ORF type:complete len:164 (+),score=50.33 GHRR01006492.1:1258-1749(+)
MLPSQTAVSLGPLLLYPGAQHPMLTSTCVFCASPVGTFYAFCAGLALLQFLWHFPSSATPLFSQDLGPIALLLKQARGAGMVLAGVVWYVLKDAADRGRLAASTFKQLNLAMAVVAALQLWAYWQMSVAGVPLNRQLWRVLMGTGLLVVAVCDWQFFAKKAGA